MKYLSALLLVFALGCNGGDSLNENYIEKSRAGDSSYDDLQLEEPVSIEAIEGVSPGKQVQQIIKTARLAFESKDPALTHQKIQELAKKLNGFIQNDVSGKSYNRHYYTLSVRIPTEQFQAFVDGISEGVAYFDTKDISRKDVTEEFVDLKARLKAKRELENRYLALLKEARNVKEMLEIERELSNIREEIEAKQGRLNYLKDQVSLSTVHIEFYEYTTETGVTVSYGQKMLNALKGGWDGISVFFLGILYLWPLLLVVIIIILVVRRIVKKQKRKN